MLRHKWFVFLACQKAGLIGRGLVHDLSKFTPSEWFPYVEYFYGEHAGKRQKPWYVQDAFDRAWLLHQNRNPHHWQYWTEVSRDIIIGSGVTTSDEYRLGDCPCLREARTAVHSSGWRQKFAQGAVWRRIGRLFGMVDRYGDIVPDAILSRRACTENETQNTTRNIIGTGMQRIRKLSVTVCESICKKYGVSFLSIMEVLRRPVLVAAKHIMNSSLWITSKVAARSIGKNLHPAWAGIKPILGRSRTIFRPSSESSAITVIPHLGTLGIVRIKPKDALIYDNGCAVCLRCKQPLTVTRCLPMPDECIREMICDWRGASRALNKGKDDTRAWYAKNRWCIQLNDTTRERVDWYIRNGYAQ